MTITIMMLNEDGTDSKITRTFSNSVDADYHQRILTKAGIEYRMFFDCK